MFAALDSTKEMAVKRAIRCSIVIVSIAILCSLVLFMLRRHTVLFTLNEAGSGSEDPCFCCVQPFSRSHA